MNTYTTVRIILQAGFVLLCFFCAKGSSPEGKLWEYCGDERFHPVCADDEVVVMETARYGHIKLGRCLDADLGSLGCFLDQLSVMDRLCSGKQVCDIHFGDSDLEGELPCKLKKVFARYLEASFTCSKVFQVQQRCSGPLDVAVISRTNYLSSKTTVENNCGAESSPWVLKAREGQQINVTFIDFMWKYHSRSESATRCPMQYGYILDLANNNIVNLCGGLIRERSLYVSEGSSLQVMIDKNVVNDVSFLIGYKVVGCPKFKAAQNTWVKEEEDHMTVGCVGSTEAWRMRCIGTHWLGPQRDCLKFNDQAMEIKLAQIASQETKFLGMSHVVASALFGGLSVVIASVIVTVGIGIFCVRKPKRKSKGEILFSPGNSNTPQLVPIDNFPTYKSVQVKLPKQRVDNATLQSAGPESLNTMSSVGSVPRYPAPSQRDSPHYYLLEGREVNDTEPLYDVVYQGLPTENV